jgi:hypothetical protein
LGPEKADKGTAGLACGIAPLPGTQSQAKKAVGIRAR